MMIRQGKKDLIAVDSNELKEENLKLQDSDDDEAHKESQEQSSSDLDSDEELNRWICLDLLMVKPTFLH